MELNVRPAIDGVFRVSVDGRAAGYVVEAGPVFVSLRGEIYNTAVEVAQSTDFEQAVRMLTREVLATR